MIKMYPAFRKIVKPLIPLAGSCRSLICVVKKMDKVTYVKKTRKFRSA